MTDLKKSIETASRAKLLMQVVKASETIAHYAEEKASWSTAEIDDFPDSSFLHVEGGGSKDDTGKTTPRSLRHFPYRDAAGKVDLPHLRNALSRIPQSNLSADEKDKLTAHAQSLLASAEKDAGGPAPGTGDMASGDLAAGGLTAPTQAPARPFKPHKPPSVVVKTVDFQGMPVHIDRPRGYTMTGTDEKGKVWKRIYHTDYGFVPKTSGGDGEGVDVFLGLDNEAKDAHWILQKKADGTFDEYKVMLGFGDADMAKGMYLAHVPKRFYGGSATTSVEMMKALLGLHPSETLKALAGFIEDAAPVEKILKHESDGWHVYSEDGSKHLGGPYPSKEQAVARIAEVEGHKEDSAKSIERTVKIFPETAMLKAAAEPGAPEQRYVLGIVLEPETTDAQGDIYSGEEIRRAAWDYMANFRNVGLMHKGLVNGKVKLVESYLAPVQMNIGGSQIKAGTWMMGLNVLDDALWAQTKTGGLTGLSIGGFAAKSPVTPG